ncbi:MAG: hypothetical protein CMJ89_05955 [Planctomycetes bacterium]|nr:hypothetical protein [Planctomycetota bacterium]
MRLLTRSFLLSFAALLIATAVGFAVQVQSRGIHNIRPENPSVSHTFDVPAGSTTFQATACDSDLFFDDMLAAEDWEPIPTDADGNTVDELTVTIGLFCSGGEVYGGEGPSGEGCAEVYIKVEWNNENGDDECDPQSVCCSSSVSIDPAGN